MRHREVYEYGTSLKFLFVNNPVVRRDTSGYVWETVFDVVSLGLSIADVAANPNDPWAWAGLIGDVVDVAVPFVGGVGEVIKAAKYVNKAADVVDTIHDVNRVAESVDSVTDASKNVTRVTNNMRSSAVRQAWKNEVSLVESTGKGTRAWTDIEIEELLTNGKVNGYVGHHMMSVKGYPELAGDPFNIQFLTRREHLLAHGGNWRNITHGRYLP